MTVNEPPLSRLGQALHDVEELTTTVEQLTEVINTERATTKRFRYNMIGLALLMMANLTGSAFAYRASREAKNVGDTLKDCLVVGGECYEQLARNGQLGSNRLMDFNGCMFLVEPAVRTNSDLDRCKKEADKNFFDNLDKVVNNAPKTED